MSTSLIHAQYRHGTGGPVGELAKVALISMVSLVAVLLLIVALFTPRSDTQVLAPEPPYPPAVIDKLVEPLAPPKGAPAIRQPIGGSTSPHGVE